MQRGIIEMHHHAWVSRNAVRLVAAAVSMEAQAARTRIKTAQHNGTQAWRTRIIQARKRWGVQGAAPIRHGIGQ
jgi:hypothetical protein